MKPKPRQNLARATVALTLGASLALAAPLAASAHVTVEPSNTGAGSYTVLTFAIPHGCDGSATTAIDITIPDQLPSVTPTVNPGWDVSITRDANRVTTVTYTAHTPLAHELRDTFELSLRLPDDAAGETLLFPVLQTCVEGAADWASTDPADPYPAPFVLITESTGHGHDHGHSIDSSTSDDTSASHNETGDTQDAPADEAAGGASEGGTADALARTFGIAGLVLGAVAIMVAFVRRRSPGVAVANEANGTEARP